MKAPTGLPLAPADLHVWKASLNPSPQQVEKLKTLLSDDEISRASRFKFDRHRRRFIVGRGILRKLLGGYLGMAPEAVKFYSTKFDKPYIKHMLGKHELCFNVSHSHEMALYAFARNRLLGVDIEHERVIKDIDKIATHFFSSTEVEKLSSLPADAQQAAFLTCWTRKEAYIKAIGEGLSHPLDTFDVTFLSGEPPALLRVANDPSAPQTWAMINLDPHADYFAALAVNHRNWQLKCFDFDQPIAPIDE